METDLTLFLVVPSRSQESREQLREPVPFRRNGVSGTRSVGTTGSCVGEDGNEVGERLGTGNEVGTLPIPSLSATVLDGIVCIDGDTGLDASNARKRIERHKSDKCSSCRQRAPEPFRRTCSRCAMNRLKSRNSSTPFSLEERMAIPRVRILRVLNRHDWVQSQELLDMAGAPSEVCDRGRGGTRNPLQRERNRYAQALSHLIPSLLAEHRGSAGSREYRITEAGKKYLRLALSVDMTEVEP